MALSSYAYEALSSESSFRLFRIRKSQPSSDASVDMFSIHLFEASFDHSPEFEAVSYAWGQDPPSSVIVCDGKPLHVTPNVEAILRVLSAQVESVGVFWIDSICIDQSNVDEKNIQVPRMRSIYSEAKIVWIWLGEGSYETKTAFSFLLEVGANSGNDKESCVRVAHLVKGWQGEMTDHEIAGEVLLTVNFQTLFVKPEDTTIVSTPISSSICSTYPGSIVHGQCKSSSWRRKQS
jgi:hypothetical protein